MLKRLVNEARFTLSITTTGPVLVRAGHATLSGPDMTPVLTFRDGDWQVYLPGSSLKGVARSHLEKIGRTLREGVICNPFHKPPEPDAFCGLKFQARKDHQEIDSQVAYRESCPICRLFGSTEFIGRVSIDDAYLTSWNGRNPVESRNGVGIDRLTGGAYGSALFDLEAVSSDVAFQTEVYLRNFEMWQLGMLLLVVQDLEDGLVRVGSGRSRGLGSVKGSVDTLRINYLGRLGDKPATAMWGLGKFLARSNDTGYGTQPDDVLDVIPAPTETRRGIRLQTTFQGESLADLREKAIAAVVDRLQNWQVPAKMRGRIP